jgi:hypothetical protein
MNHGHDLHNAKREPLILLNVSASGHAHASHLFTMPKNGLTAMDRDAEGIKFAILSTRSSSC